MKTPLSWKMLWLAGEWRDSRGCNMEYGFAKAKGIPIKFINNLKVIGSALIAGSLSDEKGL